MSSGDLHHRSHRQIHFVGAQHRQTIAPGDVVHLQFDARILLDEGLDRLGQDVEDGRLAGGDVQHPLIHAPGLGGEGLVELVHALDQWLGHLEQQISLGRELDLGSAALEEHGPELAFERLDLERYGWLTEKDLLGGSTDAAGARGMAESAQLLESVLFVMNLGA